MKGPGIDALDRVYSKRGRLLPAGSEIRPDGSVRYPWFGKEPCVCGGHKSAKAKQCQYCRYVVVAAPPRLCSCGNTMSAASKSMCLACFNRARAAQSRPCSECGKPVEPTRTQRAGVNSTSWRKTCSPECLRARRAAFATARRGPDTTAREAMRRRRSRATALRRARGAKTGRAATGRWRRICARDGWVCWLCGGAIAREHVGVNHPRNGTADHVVPLALGGVDADENLRAAHFGCNSRKAAGQRPLRARRAREVRDGR